ncbi:MAG: flagellar hook-length control protein FliK [Pseudomonadota bacterium]|nr:flagellar hook-length control protein FliK [Pseudomonadota bacterium]
MTPVSLSEPGFLKVDAPKAAVAASGTAPKGETFGNLIHEATGDASSEAEGTQIVVTAEGETAEQDTEGKETALKIASATKEGEDDALGLPPIARLPKGGLTTAKPEAVATPVPASDKPTRAAEAAHDAEGVVIAAGDAKPVQQVVTEAAVKGTPQTVAPTGDAPVEASVDAPTEAAQVIKTAATVAAPLAAQPEGDTAPETVSADTPESLKAQATREKLATSTASVTAQTAEVAQTAKQAEAKDAKPGKTAKSPVEAVAKSEKPAKSAEVTDVAPEQTVAAQPVEQVKALPDADAALPDAAQVTAQPVAQDDAQQQAAEITGQAVAPAGQTAQNTTTALSAPTTAAQLRSAAGQRMASTAPQALQAGTQTAAASTLSRVQSAANAKSPVVGKPALTAQAEQTAPALSRTGAEPRFAVEMAAVDPMQQALSPEMIVSDTETDTVASLIADKGLPQQVPQGQPTAAPMVQVQQSPDSFTMPAGDTQRPSLANSELSLEDANWPETMVENFGLEQLADGEAIEIQLTPENMGRVQLRMELRDGQASVMIVTETAEAARQFNDNQQRLSEMMAKAGIELANHDASTGRQNLGGQGGQGNGNGNANGIAGQNGEDMNQTSTAQKQRDPNRLVDVEA